MKPFLIRPISCLKKNQIILPGDKSISHRALILSALAKGETVILNLALNQDCLFTLTGLKNLGVDIKRSRNITVLGKGLTGFKKPQKPIFVGDSGTTLRLLLGLLAGQDFKVKLNAARSLARRPMLRVNKPLRMMGAVINAKSKKKNSKNSEEYPPLTIRGGVLRPIIYNMPVASAQVKSAILLAGLYCKGKTKIIEPTLSRDHTERMLKLFKADIKVQGNIIVITGRRNLVTPGQIYIPGDISSAAFFMVLAAILPNTQLLIKNVSLNPSRSGVIKVLKRMGGNIKICLKKNHLLGAEPMGDIRVKSSILKGTNIKREEIPALIDELPILMVAATYAKGRSVFDGVEELRVKETDRIKSMLDNLKRMGSDIKVLKARKSEKLIIMGGKELKGSFLKTFGDHRTAMSMIIAGLLARGSTSIDDINCINKSFPGFIPFLNKIIK